MASNRFNSEQVYEMVLRDGSDLEDEKIVEEYFDGDGSYLTGCDEFPWRHVSCKERTCQQEFSVNLTSSFKIKKNENSKCCLNISFKLNVGSFYAKSCYNICSFVLLRKKLRGIFPGKVC